MKTNGRWCYLSSEVKFFKQKSSSIASEDLHRFGTFAYSQLTNLLTRSQSVMRCIDTNPKKVLPGQICFISRIDNMFYFILSKSICEIYIVNWKPVCCSVPKILVPKKIRKNGKRNIQNEFHLFCSKLQHHQIDTPRVIKLKFHLPPYNYVCDCLSLAITSVYSRQIITSIYRERKKWSESHIFTIFADHYKLKKKIIYKEMILWSTIDVATLCHQIFFPLSLSLSTFSSLFPTLRCLHVNIYQELWNTLKKPNKKIAYYWNSFDKH